MNGRGVLFFSDHVKDVQTTEMGRRSHTVQVLDFIFVIQVGEIFADWVTNVRYLLIDLFGVVAVGAETQTALIICNYVGAQIVSSPDSLSVPILFDTRRVSSTGALLAGGMIIDSTTAHYGSKLTKGHVGSGILATTLAYLYEVGRTYDLAELLISLV